MSEDLSYLSKSLENTEIDDEDILIDVDDETPVAVKAEIETENNTDNNLGNNAAQQLKNDAQSHIDSTANDGDTLPPLLPPKTDSDYTAKTSTAAKSVQQYQADTPTFDFHRFLEQMKEPSSAPIARNTKGFISLFCRREACAVDEQIKVIQNFLNFTYDKMRDCDVWRDISEKEFENAKEGMEKLVMNRLFNVTFSPDTTDDKEKDNILHHKISIFRWIREDYLDIPKTKDNDSFLTFAECELLKMNNYKAPRDKLICILNCCKVIFGLMKHMDRDEGADVFLPLLIYVVIRANPPRLISNVHYISRFKNPDHLRAEAGYYLTNLMGAIEFIETMDITSLSISQEEFDVNIERTMRELDQEQPDISSTTSDKQKISYENAVHPLHQKRKQKEQQPLIDLGSDIAQKSIHFVGRLFSDSNNNSDSETTVTGSSHTKDRPKDRYNHEYATDGPSSLAQELPKPPASANINKALPIPAVKNDENSRNEFDDHLSTIVSMFPNIEPGVCYMILQASQGKLPETIERLLDMSDEQPS